MSDGLRLFKRCKECQYLVPPTFVYCPTCNAGKTLQRSTIKKEATVNDNINHPTHYNQGKIEVIEFIEDQGFSEGFCKGNAIKYISRAGKKDPGKEIEDLKKAAWYVNRYIEVLEARQENRDPLRPNDMAKKT